MLCISPRRDLLVRDPADAASRLGISVGNVHNPDTVSLPLMLCWDLRGGCRGAKGGSCISVSSAYSDNENSIPATACLSIRLAPQSKPVSRRAWSMPVLLGVSPGALGLLGLLPHAAFQQAYLPALGPRLGGAWGL